MFISLFQLPGIWYSKFKLLPPQVKAGMVAIPLGLGCVSLGLLQLYWVANAPLPDVKLSQDEPLNIGWLMVDVSGAVIQPGVYQLETGDRLANAIKLAGGVLPQADPLFVSQKLNLAEPIKDGQKIYIPYANEVKDVEASEREGEISGAEIPDSNLISINNATASELDSLPGIGPARVEAIIGQRPYTTLDELVTRKVLTEAIFGEIKGLVSL